jgi:hypothetical protein
MDVARICQLINIESIDLLAGKGVGSLKYFVLFVIGAVTISFSPISRHTLWPYLLEPGN